MTDTNKKYLEIKQAILNLREAEIAGLVVLLLLAISRERTSVRQQWKELQFIDVPEWLVVQLDNEIGNRECLLMALELTWKLYMDSYIMTIVTKLKDNITVSLADRPIPKKLEIPDNLRSLLNMDLEVE